MKWIEVRVNYEGGDRELAADLISAIFQDLDVKGVIIEGSPPVPDTDWADDIVPELLEPAVVGFFPDIGPSAEKLRVLENRLAELKTRTGVKWKIGYRKIDEEDWATSWKRFFHPERIDDGVVVKPTWREYDAKSGETVIEIDPGMAFGTGTHPTTILCIRMIKKYMKPGSTFLDVGTGSGILMAAAAKFGASRLLGVDSDITVIDIARENLLKNNVNPRIFRVQEGDLIKGIDERFDVISANILTHVIIELLKRVKNVMSENGILICSGILEEKMETVIKKMEKTGFGILETEQLGSWVGIVATLV